MNAFKLRPILSLAAMATFGSLWVNAPAMGQTVEVTSEQAASALAELRVKYSDSQDRFMTIAGIEVAYRDEGAGPAILLIHGSSSNMRSFDRVAELLTKKFRVIRYDVPPFGISGPVDNLDLTGVAPTDIPAGLLKGLGIDSATIVGTSFGGSIALNLASVHPDIVDRLIISNSPSDPVGQINYEYLGPTFTAALKKYGLTGPRPMEFWVPNLEYYYGEPSRLRRETAQQAMDFDRPIPKRNVLAMISLTADNKAVRAAYGKVRGPVLLLWGGRDPMLPVSAAKNLATYIPQAEVSTMIMPDVGHYPAMEVPDRYAALVEAYIRMATPVRPVAPPPLER